MFHKKLQDCLLIVLMLVVAASPIAMAKYVSACETRTNTYTSYYSVPSTTKCSTTTCIQWWTIPWWTFTCTTKSVELLTLTQTQTLTQTASTESVTVTQTAPTETSTITGTSETDTVTSIQTQIATTTVNVVTTAAVIPSYVILGTPLGPIRTTLPIGTISAAWIDATASSILEGMLVNPQFGFDTNGNFVDQSSGAPAPAPTSVFVMSGGPIVNAPVKYYEQNYVSQGTPIHFGFDGSNYAFYDIHGTIIPGTSVNPATLGSSTDYFLIESFVDSNGNNVLIIYGYGGRGTFAGALYFKEALFPSGGNLLAPGVRIVQWVDKNGNGLPDFGIDSFNTIYDASSWPAYP